MTSELRKTPAGHYGAARYARVLARAVHRPHDPDQLRAARRRARSDREHLYTLAPGTPTHRQMRSRSPSTSTSSSRRTRRAQSPQLQAYAQRVRELLEEMAARSKGKLRLHGASTRSRSRKTRIAPRSSACARCPTGSERRVALLRARRHELDRRPRDHRVLPARARKSFSSTTSRSLIIELATPEEAGDRRALDAAHGRATSIP